MDKNKFLLASTNVLKMTDYTYLMVKLEIIKVIPLKTGGLTPKKMSSQS